MSLSTSSAPIKDELEQSHNQYYDTDTKHSSCSNPHSVYSKHSVNPIYRIKKPKTQMEIDLNSLVTNPKLPTEKPTYGNQNKISTHQPTSTPHPNHQSTPTIPTTSTSSLLSPPSSPPFSSTASLSLNTSTFTSDQQLTLDSNSSSQPSSPLIGNKWKAADYESWGNHLHNLAIQPRSNSPPMATVNRSHGFSIGNPNTMMNDYHIYTRDNHNPHHNNNPHHNPHYHTSHHNSPQHDSSSESYPSRLSPIKYTKHKPTENILGFLINLHDPVNMDIDLFLPDELKSRYHNVIMSSYTYYDTPSTYSSSLSKDDDHIPEIRNGVSYRCRWRDIAVTPGRYRSSKTQGQKFRRTYAELMRQFCKQNNFVSVTVSDVDIYQRLLVDIFDPVSGMNLKDIHLREGNEEVFTTYASKINRSRNSDSSSYSHSHSYLHSSSSHSSSSHSHVRDNHERRRSILHENLYHERSDHNNSNNHNNSHPEMTSVTPITPVTSIASILDFHSKVSHISHTSPHNSWNVVEVKTSTPIPIPNPFNSSNTSNPSNLPNHPYSDGWIYPKYSANRNDRRKNNWLQYRKQASLNRGHDSDSPENSSDSDDRNKPKTPKITGNEKIKIPNTTVISNKTIGAS